MSDQHEHASVRRVRAALESAGIATDIKHLDESAGTAVLAAAALGVEVGQIASSIVFKVSTPEGDRPVLVVTSGRHRVDTNLVADTAGLAKLGRADADFVREWSGFAIGGVSPVGWIHAGESFKPITIVDTALADYQVIWAACGLHDVVCSMTFDDVVAVTGGTPLAAAIE